MRKNNKLFKIFIPVMLFSVLIAITFASLALSITYIEDTGNINMKSPLAIFFVITILAALVTPIIFVFLFKDLRITRTKRDLLSTKITSAILTLIIIAFEICDLIYIIKLGVSSSQFDAWRFVRFLLAFLVIVHLIFEVLPSKINLPLAVKYTANAAIPLYTVASILTIYFYKGAEPLPEYFEILFIISYSLITLFTLFDFKWKLISTNAKAYVALSSVAFVFGTTVSMASIMGTISRKGIFAPEQAAICVFEMILILALSVYSLSKTLAVQATVAHIVKLAHEHKHAHDRDGEND